MNGNRQLCSHCSFIHESQLQCKSLTSHIGPEFRIPVSRAFCPETFPACCRPAPGLRVRTDSASCLHALPVFHCRPHTATRFQAAHCIGSDSAFCSHTPPEPGLCLPGPHLPPGLQNRLSFPDFPGPQMQLPEHSPVPALQIHGFPYPVCQTMSAEIPSPVHLGLPDYHPGTVLRRPDICSVDSFCPFYRRYDTYCQRIIAPVPKHFSHIKSVRDKHIIGLTHTNPIKPYFRQRVDSLEAKQILLPLQILPTVEFLHIEPVALLNPSFPIQIFPQIITVYKPLFPQDGPHVSRHPGIQIPCREKIL